MSVERDLFIRKYSPAVINATRGTGLFPSVKMAQLLIESANTKGEPGKGLSFLKANNGFGIKKGKGWKGETIILPTPKDASKKSEFRKYNNVKDSIVDHSRFMLLNSRYRDNGVFDSITPEVQARRIASAGYSESPTYASALIKIIDGYKLKNLDGKTQKNIFGITKKDILLGVLFTGGGIVANELLKKKRRK